MELDAAVLDWAFDRVIDGYSYKEIAEALNVPKTTLYKAMQSTQALRERSAQALQASAESWLDRGLDALVAAMQKNGPVDPQAARAYAQECARRAAIRNPSYKEKAEVAITGKDGGPLRVAQITANVTAEQAALAYKEMLG